MVDPWILLILAAIAGLGAWFVKSEAQSDAAPVTPPAERPPPENEVRQILADLRVALGNVREELERQHTHHDEELQAIGRKLTRIEGQLDRIESNRALEGALASIYRQQRET